MDFRRRLPLLNVIMLSYLCMLSAAIATVLPESEVEALKEIWQTLGKKDWDFSVDPCSSQQKWTRFDRFNVEVINNVTCNCTTTVCHVVSIVLKTQNLDGVLPPELVKLPHLQQIDLSRNYLNGSIPKDWGSMQLVNISLLGNRVSGQLPIELGNITTLKVLALDFNQLSGALPPELGNMKSIEKITLTSNNFTGPLPDDLSTLTTLKDFRISGNNFIGTIPDFIQHLTNLEKLVIQASGLQGPIPSNISLLTKMTDLRISNLNGMNIAFPQLRYMKNLKTLILRSCNISGGIPSYLGDLMKLKTLDLSFNNLAGEIPSGLEKAKFMYLTGNAFTGTVPGWILTSGRNIDLSYNNFTLIASDSPCQQRNINFFGSPSLKNNSAKSGIVPCLKSFRCPRKSYYSFHINCGGDGNTKYEDDVDAGGPSRFYRSTSNWAFSSTGDFMDNDNEDDIYIAKTNASGVTMNDYQLYTTARVSPVSLTYYGFCLINNKNYSVSLHFAEIMFTNDRTYSSLGRRIFDIYIQGKLVQKDFNIKDEAGGAGKEVIRNYTALVTDSTLEIRFYWSGKGTDGIPSRGTYGPLVSAISVDPDFTPPPEDGNTISPGIVVGIVLSILIVIFIVCVLWWKGCFEQKNEIDKDLRGLDLQTGTFTLRQIKAATNNFAAENKIGEGGFGSVYKGNLLDGTVIAVKQLSAKSKQGNREFVNEIGMISALQHPNLVKLHGCCIEGNQLLLIYEYMENNSLARALFGHEEYQLILDWPTRYKICVGLAKALAYLHEESRLKIVHRDIKATNVLLDKDLNAKVSDFGLAKLDEEDNSHISTRIAGTFGYMAPEYAMKGYLTDKADVYSFGVVALEIVSGRSNTNYKAKEECVYLLDWALILQEKGDLLELVDPTMKSSYIKEEALVMINVALHCTNTIPTLRPTMSSVVSMLEGRTGVAKFTSDSSISGENAELKVSTNQYRAGQDSNPSTDQSQSMLSDGPWTERSTSSSDLYPMNPDSQYWKIREESRS